MLNYSATSTAQAAAQKRTAACPQQALNHRHAVRVNSAAGTSSSAPPSPPVNPLLMSAVGALFKFPPFFNMATKGARNMIMKRAESIGIDWEGTMKELKEQDWGKYLRDVENPTVRYPSYYTKPFHAYPKGNLCLDAALEVSMAAKSVHALVMDPNGKEMDPEGDLKLRQGYSSKLKECMSELNVEASSIKDILDMGCATGLSSVELMNVFVGNSGLQVTGIDLSPQFLVVGSYEQQRREKESGTKEPITFKHIAAEATGMPDASYDLISVCLVLHEMPQYATKALLKEAQRLLRPGGVLSIMEMNPASPAFQRVLGNPFAFTAFRSTEPWLEEYITLDLHAAIQEVGFSAPLQKLATPRHRTVVAVKPHA